MILFYGVKHPGRRWVCATCGVDPQARRRTSRTRKFLAALLREQLALIQPAEDRTCLFCDSELLLASGVAGCPSCGVRRESLPA